MKGERGKSETSSLRESLTLKLMKPAAFMTTQSHSLAYLVTAGTAGPHALAIVASTQQSSVHPEVHQIHQPLPTLGTHKAGGVPELLVRGPLSTHYWTVHRRQLPTATAPLAGARETHLSMYTGMP